MNGSRASLSQVLLAAIFAAAVTTLQATGILRVRYALAAVAVFAIVAVAKAINANRDNALASIAKQGIAIATFLAGFLVAILLSPASGDPYQVTIQLTVWLLGWTIYLFSSSGTTEAGEVSPLRVAHARQTTSPTMRDTLLVGIVAMMVLATVGTIVAGGATLVVDDTLYVLQARLFGKPRFSLPLDAAVQPFFQIRQTAYLRGGMFSHYLPGWPALLAVFDSAGIIRWAGAVLGAASVALTYNLGARIYSSRVGIMAAALLVLHPLFLDSGNLFGSHAASIFFLLLVAHLSLGDSGSGRVQIWRWLTAGLCLGVAGAVRPLTGLTLGVSIACWYMIRARPGVRRMISVSTLVFAGASPILIATGYYNHITTGKATRFGYTAASGEHHALGFGTRGSATYGNRGEPRLKVEQFTPQAAIIRQASVLWVNLLSILPVALLVPFGLMARRYGPPFEWQTFAAFLALPIGYGLWFSNAPHFHVDLLPFAFVAVAAVFEHVRALNPMLGRTLGVFLVLLVPSIAITDTYVDRGVFRPCRQTYRDVDQLSKRGNTLVFVSEKPSRRGAERLLECLFVFNTYGLEGKVVVARDLGASNGVLMDRYPEHRALRVSWDDARSASVIEELGEPPE